MAKRKRKSRLQRTEAQHERRAALIYVSLTIGLIVLIFAYGFGFLSTVTSAVSDYFKNELPIVSDTIAPAPPRLFIDSEFVNSDEIELEGTAEAGSTAVVHVNSSEHETVVDARGEFGLSVDLKEGENKIFATAKDSAGNVSQKSREYEIYFDTQAPVIAIEQPTGGQEFSGSEKEIEIKGSIGEKGSLSVNGRNVYVSSNGNFETNIGLNEGENKLEFKASDLAGNEAEANLTVKYRP